MADDDLAVESTAGYVAPKQVALDDLKNLDADDEALNRWKAQLLAGGGAAASDDPRRVIVESIALQVDGRPDATIDLTGDLTILKASPLVLKEKCEFRWVINFKVQHEVVSGLKYVHAVYRKGIRVAKDQHMLGSYGPKDDSQSARTPMEECPGGMLARGHYTVKSNPAMQSKFLDDDGNSHLMWEWAFDIKKDWA